MFFPIVVIILTGYLLGNLNGAVSISVLFGHDDVRSHGSGNAGLTNFVRSYGLARAGLVIIIDMLKAALACLVGRLIMPAPYAMEGAMLGAISVSLGHDFPALLGFRGGKGILCALAVGLSLDWRIALICLAIFIVLVALTKYVSLGSVVGMFGVAVLFIVFYPDRPWLIAGGIVLSALAIFMHRGNIARLLNGTERKIGSGKKGKKA
jgi:glycerol-3-phosphate acyltransferase PlsY